MEVSNVLSALKAFAVSNFYNGVISVAVRDSQKIFSRLNKKADY